MNARAYWWWFAALLASTLVAQAFIDLPAHFGADGWFAFNAAFGLLACAAMVAVAKWLGIVLKRSDRYYEDRTRSGPADIGSAEDRASSPSVGRND